MTRTKPHLVAKLVPQETPLEAARKRAWTKGVYFWTPERIAELKAQNEVIRQLRGK